MKLTCVLLSILQVLYASVPIYAQTRDDVIYQTDNIVVYQDEQSEERYALVEINEFNEGETITIYIDPVTNETVAIEVIKSEPLLNIGLFEYNGGNWSGGYIPTGAHTLRPHIINPRYPGGEIGYYLDVTAYPVKFLAEACFIADNATDTAKYDRGSDQVL